MNYTLKQKRDASQHGQLWYRYPLSKHELDRAWDLLIVVKEGDPMLALEGAEYFIGPTPPRVLSELEGELLEALKYARRFLKPEDHDCNFVDAAIQKAESTP